MATIMSLRDIRRGARKLQKMMRCSHVRGSHVVPGWGCCRCRGYNGYQRSHCRVCGHPSCYETTSHEGREALELKPIGDDPDLVSDWMKKNGR